MRNLRAAGFLVMLLFICNTADAQYLSKDSRKEFNAGTRAFGKEDFIKAENAFSRAERMLLLNPVDSAELQDALYWLRFWRYTSAAFRWMGKDSGVIFLDTALEYYRRLEFTVWMDEYADYIWMVRAGLMKLQYDRYSGNPAIQLEIAEQMSELADNYNDRGFSADARLLHAEALTDNHLFEMAIELLNGFDSIRYRNPSGDSRSDFLWMPDHLDWDQLMRYYTDRIRYCINLKDYQNAGELLRVSRDFFQPDNAKRRGLEEMAEWHQLHAYYYLRTDSFIRAYQAFGPLWERCRGNDPSYAGSVMLGAMILDRLDSVLIAEKWYRRAVDLFHSGGFSELDAARSRLNLANFLTRRQNLIGAKQQYSQSISELETYFSNTVPGFTRSMKRNLLEETADFGDQVCWFARSGLIAPDSLASLFLRISVCFKGLLYRSERILLDSARNDYSSDLPELIEQSANGYRLSADDLSNSTEEEERRIIREKLRFFKSPYPDPDSLLSLVSNDMLMMDYLSFLPVGSEPEGKTYLSLVYGNNQGMHLLLDSIADQDTAAAAGNGIASNSRGAAASSEGYPSDRRMLLPPENHLLGIRKLNICPSGVAYRYPFAAHPRGNGYLMDSFRLTFYTSLTDALKPSADEVNVRDMVTMAFGAARFDSVPDISVKRTEPWHQLPGTRIELHMLNRSLKTDWWVSIHMGMEFKEEDIKSVQNYRFRNFIETGRQLAGYDSLTHRKTYIYQYDTIEKSAPDIIHLATHGFYLPYAFQGSVFQRQADPLMRTGLVCSGGNFGWNNDTAVIRHTKEDGILTALEISAMDLRGVKLVVLSACETGRGDNLRNEGLMGLPRAFKLAGVEHLIVSLWPVPDRETAEFMRTFYTHLSESQNISEAFRQTQLELSKVMDPNAWAAFVLLH